MPVNLEQTLESLRQELARVEAAITAMEELQRDQQDGTHVAKRDNRGRKSMGAEERLAVSERMKKYWAGRRSGPEGRLTDVEKTAQTRVSAAAPKLGGSTRNTLNWTE